MPVMKADLDKPARCPACWTIPDRIWDSGRTRFWRTYTCRNGHRFALWRRPWHYSAGYQAWRLHRRVTWWLADRAERKRR
jgi:hypothetical protein